MHWVPHLTVAAVVEHDRRFLLVEERIGGQLVLNQPAGHVEDGESLLDAVVREVLEETAREFEPRALVGIYRWRPPDADDTFFRFCFTGHLHRHHRDRPLDAGIVQTVWLTEAALELQSRRHRSPMVGRCVADYLAGKRYPLTLLTDLDNT